MNIKKITPPGINYKMICIILLCSMYLAGLLLLLDPSTQKFALAFTPVHLLLSTGILLSFHVSDRYSGIVFFILFSTLFWIIEWLGVYSGFPFGAYHYGTVLGWAIAGIPLLIGINWATYLYVIHSVLLAVSLPWPIKIVIGASILVLLDWFIEPVAVYFNFWYWETTHQQPPLANYVSWWCLSLMGLYLLHQCYKHENALARVFLLLQFLFFGIINIL